MFSFSLGFSLLRQPSQYRFKNWLHLSNPERRMSANPPRQISPASYPLRKAGWSQWTYAAFPTPQGSLSLSYNFWSALGHLSGVFKHLYFLASNEPIPSLHSSKVLSLLTFAPFVNLRMCCLHFVLGNVFWLIRAGTWVLMLPVTSSSFLQPLCVLTLAKAVPPHVLVPFKSDKHICKSQTGKSRKKRSKSAHAPDTWTLLLRITHQDSFYTQTHMVL